MDREPSPRKGITVSYGLFAAILLLTLLVGAVSGGLVVGAATLLLAGRLPALAVEGRSPVGPAAAGRAWIGITYVPMTAAVASSRGLTVTFGAYVTGVTPGGPADKADLQEGDVITAVDGRPLDESTALVNLIATRKPGDTVRLAVVRGGRELNVDVSLGRWPGVAPSRRELIPLERLRENITRLLESR